MTAPTTDRVEKEMELAWHAIDFRSPAWLNFETYLQWRILSIGQACLKADQEAYQQMNRGKYSLAQEFLRFAEDARRHAPPDPDATV